MPSLADVVAEHTGLDAEERQRLEALVSQAHLIADLAFSDLVVWVADHDPNVFWAASQIRPVTGPTCLFEDVIGDPIAYVPEHLVSESFGSGEITRTSDNKLRAGIPVAVTAVPVRFRGRVIAVLERHTNQFSVRNPSPLEQNYLQIADELTEMVAEGTFPIEADWVDAGGPHVGDGLIRLDEDGRVSYASPNAVSAFRRLGWWMDLDDELLPEISEQVAPSGPQPRHETAATVLSGRVAGETELVTGYAQIQARALPLTTGGHRRGAIVLLRDVTDLRRRERELVTKTATIREMHHRVKNNLQTVAALLRMQARRMAVPEAAEALRAAMARVSSIAVVHEVLSQAYDDEVDFDEVMDQILRMLATVAATEQSASVRKLGTFGQVSADVATSLSLVLTELCQNAIEHGLEQGAGLVEVEPEALGSRLRIRVRDRGRGLPEGFELGRTTSLGLSIVQTLIDDLNGRFTLEPNPDGPGTCAEVVVPRSR